MEVIRGMSGRDLSRIEPIVRSSALFCDEEIAVALEICAAAATEGEGSGYLALVIGTDESAFGFAIFGPTPDTDRTWDLYWIAVEDGMQGRGVGSRLLDAVEAAIGQRHGRMLVVETSSRDAYSATRRFYERRGYGNDARWRARLRDFYAPGDDRVVLMKRVEGRVGSHDTLANGGGVG